MSGLLASLPTGAVGIYACKWVNNGYTGPILKLRANTDTGGTGMTDFYMNSAGTAIGTVTNGAGTTLSAWLLSKSSATTAYIHTWYDQSGLANNMTQTTTGNQPYLVLTSGLYNVFYSNAYTAYFENATNIIGTGKVSHTISYRVADTSNLLQVSNVACVGAVGSKTLISAGLFNNFTGGVYGMYYDFGGDYIQTNYGSALPNNITYSYSYDGTNKNAYFNKSLTPTTTQVNTTLNVATATPTRIGYCFSDATRRFQGSLSNISIFNTALSDANRTIIENIYPTTVMCGGQSNSVVLGYYDSRSLQGMNSISIGVNAGQTAQGNNAIAIGNSTAGSTQGNYSIAVGAFAGQTSQPANSIVLNASGSGLNGATASATYISPIRSTPFISGSSDLRYDATGKEVFTTGLPICASILYGFTSDLSLANNTVATAPFTSLLRSYNFSITGLSMSGGVLTNTSGYTLVINVSACVNFQNVSGYKEIWINHSVLGRIGDYTVATGSTNLINATINTILLNGENIYIALNQTTGSANTVSLNSRLSITVLNY